MKEIISYAYYATVGKKRHELDYERVSLFVETQQDVDDFENEMAEVIRREVYPKASVIEVYATVKKDKP